MPDSIDKAAQAYATAYQSAIDDVLSRYPSLAKLSPKETAKLLSTLDFEDIFRTNYGMDNALGQLAAAFAREVIVVPAPPVLPSTEVLSTALQFEIDALNSQITQNASEIKRIMMRSVLGNQSEAEFAEALTSEALRSDQINSYVNQNLRSFHRTVEVQMAEANPDDLYIWDGPLDDRTSDECVDMIAQGALTYDEWTSQYSQYLTAGTHYGCRHTLQRFVSSVQLDPARKARDEV